MNEPKRAETLIESGGILSDIKSTIFLLSRYAKLHLHLSDDDARKIVKAHIKKYAPGAHDNYIDKYITIYLNRANKYPLHAFDGVDITAKELNVIASLSGIRAKCFIFSALAVAKYDKMVWPSHNFWIHGDRIPEIARRANLTITSAGCASIIHQLYEAHMVEVSPRVDNCSFRIAFVEPIGEGAAILNLTDADFLDLGYCLRTCYGQKFTRCEECGRWIKQTKNGRRRFCQDCAADNQRALDAAYRRRKRS